MENLVTLVTGSAERHPGGTLPLYASRPASALLRQASTTTKCIHIDAWKSHHLSKKRGREISRRHTSMSPGKKYLELTLVSLFLFFPYRPNTFPSMRLKTTGLYSSLVNWSLDILSPFAPNFLSLSSRSIFNYSRHLISGNRSRYNEHCPALTFRKKKNEPNWTRWQLKVKSRDTFFFRAFQIYLNKK